MNRSEDFIPRITFDQWEHGFTDLGELVGMEVQAASQFLQSFGWMLRPNTGDYTWTFSHRTFLRIQCKSGFDLDCVERLEYCCGWSV